MESWILFVIIGQFLNATVILNDRFIVSKNIVSKPIVYAFYVSFLSIFALGAIPFGVSWPSLHTAVFSIIAGISYLLSIILFYESLKNSKASEVVPVVGGIATISTLISSAFILNTGLPTGSDKFLVGFFFLLIGMVLISHFQFTKRSFLFLIGAGIFFGLSNVLIKLIFNEAITFIDGFFWSRMANVVVALALLLVPSIWKIIFQDWADKKAGTNKNLHLKKSGRSKKVFIVLGNKILAGVAFIFMLLAIKGGNVAIVNALTATQYVFIFLFALFFHNLIPDYFNEKIHRHEFLHKLLATVLIVIGFFVLFV